MLGHSASGFCKVGLITVTASVTEPFFVEIALLVENVMPETVLIHEA
jgi:hypothetical protein